MSSWRACVPGPVESADGVGLATDVKGFRCLALHAVGQLERFDPCLERRVVRPGRRMALVEPAHQIELPPLLGREWPRRCVMFSISFWISVCWVSMYVPWYAPGRNADRQFWVATTG